MEMGSQGLKLKRVKNQICFPLTRLPKCVMEGFSKWQTVQRQGTLGRTISFSCQQKSPQRCLLSPSFMAGMLRTSMGYPSTNVLKQSALWSLFIVAVICIRYLRGKEIFLSHFRYFTAYHPKSSRLLQIYKLMPSDFANEDYVDNFSVNV